MQQLPFFLDVFLQPVRDNPQAQVAICAVLLLIALDIIFGLMNAFIHKEYSSQKMREGIAHKAIELLFVMLGVILDATIIAGIDLGYTAPVLTTICVYELVMEIGSLMETSVKIWPHLGETPVFKFLASVHVLDVKEIGGTDA